MDAREFLGRVLPDQGTYYAGMLRKGAKQMRQHAFDSIDALAAAVTAASKDPNVDVYHACASFNDDTARTQGNAFRAKSFWVDIDCGEDKAAKGKGYATKGDAWTAFKLYCRKVGLPRPLVVDSGGGLHIYFVLTTSVKKATWEPIALLLKQSMKEHGVIAGPERTADMASILRPAGSLNRKLDAARAVRVMSEGDVVDPRDFLQVVRGSVSTLPAAPKPRPDALGTLPAHLAGLKVDDAQGFPARHRSADVIAGRCAQVGLVRDTQGAHADSSYDQWRGVIGIIKHCDLTPRETAGEWTARRAEGHHNVDWQTRYDTWTGGPTTCAYFEQHNATACSQCPHKGKVTSPIQLGDSVPPAQVLPATEAVEERVWPAGFRFEPAEGMIRYVKINAGTDQETVIPRPFAKIDFRCVDHICTATGKSEVTIEVYHAAGPRRFDISMGLLSVGGAKMAEALGEHGIVKRHEKDAIANMEAYVLSDLELLRKRREEKTTLAAFGWTDDYTGFLIGDRLYQADGTMRRVLVGGGAASNKHALNDPQGSVAGYADAINWVYNRPGMEVMQYALCSGFGSILSPLIAEEFYGLGVALTGGGTGRGKTTVCRAALSAWGAHDKLTVAGWKQGATINSRWQLMGALKNIPILHDELTKVPADELSDFCYQLSLGQDKKRLKADGTPLPQQHWSMSSFVTANTDLHATLAASQGNSQAEAVRFIEMRVDEFALPVLDAGDMARYVQQISDNRGSAGEAFAKYAVANLPQVREVIRTWASVIEKLLPNPQHRFYRYHAIATMAAAELMGQLGICAFDPHILAQFAGRMLADATDTISEQNTITPEDALQRMLSDLAPRTIVTDFFREQHELPEVARLPGEAVAVARRVNSARTSKNEHGGKLFILVSAVGQWCSEHRVDRRAMLAAAHAAGYLIDCPAPIFIGRGTTITTGRARCICIDMLKLEGVPNLQLVANNPQPTKVRNGQVDERKGSC